MVELKTESSNATYTTMFSKLRGIASIYRDQAEEVLPTILQIASIHFRHIYTSRHFPPCTPMEIWESIWDTHRYNALEIPPVHLPAWKARASSMLWIALAQLGLTEFQGNGVYDYTTKILDYRRMVEVAIDLLLELEYVEGDKALGGSVMPHVSWVISSWLDNKSLEPLLDSLGMHTPDSREYEWKIKVFLRSMCGRGARVSSPTMATLARQMAFADTYGSRMNLKKDYEIEPLILGCIKLLLKNRAKYTMAEYGASPGLVLRFFELVIAVERLLIKDGRLHDSPLCHILSTRRIISDDEIWEYLSECQAMPETFWLVMEMVKEGCPNIDVSGYFRSILGENRTYALGSIQSAMGPVFRFLEYLVVQTYTGMGSIEGLLGRALKYHPEKLLGAICHNVINGEG